MAHTTPAAPRWARTYYGRTWHIVRTAGAPSTSLCGRRVVLRPDDPFPLPAETGPRCQNCEAVWQRQQRRQRQEG